MIKIENYIKDIKDFPTKGIVFKDISPLLSSPKAFQEVINEMAKHVGDADVIVSPDARGFLFGTPVAFATGKPFVMIRKPNKLPGKLISQDFDLEYGSNTLEIQEGMFKKGQKIIIIDDVLATGGTTEAIVKLIERQGATVTKALFLLELGALNGRSKYDHETESLLIVK